MRQSLEEKLWNAINNETSVRSYLMQNANANYRIPSTVSSRWVGWTLLSYATYQGYQNIATALLAFHANPDLSIVNDTAWNGWTPLSSAVYYQQHALIKLLLENTTNANQQLTTGEWAGWSLLAYSIYQLPDARTEPLLYSQAVNHIKKLLEKGAHSNQRFLNGRWAGWSLLAYTVRKNLKEIAEALLTHGATLDHTPEQDFLSLTTHAYNNGRQELAQLLKDKLYVTRKDFDQKEQRVQQLLNNNQVLAQQVENIGIMQNNQTDTQLTTLEMMTTVLQENTNFSTQNHLIRNKRNEYLLKYVLLSQALDAYKNEPLIQQILEQVSNINLQNEPQNLEDLHDNKIDDNTYEYKSPHR